MNYDRFRAQHIVDIPPSGIRRFFDITSEMKDVISLGVGEPDFVTPWNIREAATYSIEHGKTHYTSNSGLAELRELICEYLKRFSLDYRPSQVLVTVGASEGLDLALRAMLTPGDEVLVPAPSYVSYQPGIVFAHGVPVEIKTTAEHSFKLTPEALEAAITPKTKLIVVPYPNNPTGAIMTREDYELIAETIIKHDLFVLSDEIYCELTYDGTHCSIASIPGMKERTVVINGFSKAFAMTGWRLGYACAPAEIMELMLKIHQYTMLCAPIMSQYAGVEALRYELETDFRQVREMLRSYDMRRRLISEAFTKLGMASFTPQGAFYIFPSIEQTGLSSEEFCERLVFDKHVACVPGTAFGSGGEGYIRCCYATSVSGITEALRRIGEFLEEL